MTAGAAPVVWGPPAVGSGRGMTRWLWECYLAVSRKIESGGRNVDADDVPNLVVHRPLVERFMQHLSPVRSDGGRARVLAPGAMAEALTLVEAGYEVHAHVLGPDNATWLRQHDPAAAAGSGCAGKLIVRERDAHDLDYPKNFFDGYFSSQFHEHLLAWFVHLGEVRYCMRDGGIVLVDACGINDPAFHIVWHTNLVPERCVLEQWKFWGFQECWRDHHGDGGPRFVFEKLSADAESFEYRKPLSLVMRLRDGEAIVYDRAICAEAQADAWHRKWEMYLSVARGIATGGQGTDITLDPASVEAHRAFIRTFRTYLPTAQPLSGGAHAVVLAPGAVSEALELARAGYETHALPLGPENAAWLEAQRASLPDPDLLIVREMDAHALDYPVGFFDGYFTIQVHEHWLSWYVHLGELRYALRVGGIAFVDACGTTNDACAAVWHTNRVPNQQVWEQWDHWGFRERWRGPEGDDRPQFVFEALSMDDAAFRHAGYLNWSMRLRHGERIPFAYTPQDDPQGGPSLEGT